MATIHDIAEVTNTSVAAVSYVLNGKGDEKRISKETQKRILKAAERLNYRPNLSARQTRRAQGSRARLVLCWPEFHVGQANVSVMAAMQEFVRYSTEPVDLSILYYHIGQLEDLRTQLTAVSCSGAVLVGAGEKDIALLQSSPAEIPIVLINRNAEGISSVSVDYHKAGILACNAVMKSGRSTVCTVWEDNDRVSASSIRAAFESRLKEWNVSGVEYHTFRCRPTPESGYQLGLQLIRGGILPQVFYCNGEAVTEGMLAAFHEHKIVTGVDVFVLSVSYGLKEYGRYMIPSLSVIDMKLQEVILNGLRTCYALISHREEEKAPSIIVQPELILRDSMPISISLTD